MRSRVVPVMTLLCVLAGGVSDARPAQPVANAFDVVRSDETATLTFFNRPIVVLRARIMGRAPAERAAGALHRLDALAAARTTGPLELRPIDDGVLLVVAGQGIVAIVSADVEDLSGETVDSVAAQAVANLQRALREADEARAPAMLARGALLAGAALAVALLLLWGIARVHRSTAAKLVMLAEQKMTAAGIASLDALRASRLLDLQRGCVTVAAAVADLFVGYIAVTFVLRRFPYTRPWGESMRGFLIDTLARLALSVVHALPGLFTIFVIFVAARLLVRLTTVWFNAVERGQVLSRWVHLETARPTRRLTATLIWLFALVVAYPYMPGSETEAFKGVSVFLGLMITFGSSGIINQIMSGFMITYSRAVRAGDFVRIGDIEGVVSHLGVLSIKVKTLKNEEVTIPNAVVVSQTTTDFSRFGNTEGVFTPTSVTIGYDTPWRQVEAFLLLAAARTPGIRTDPKPLVIQAGLEDFYVKYTLLFCLERQETKPLTLNTLHANIQDLFNEYGVQIMSPNYVVDPRAPKVVARQHWYDAPARPAPDGARAEPAGRPEPVSRAG